MSLEETIIEYINQLQPGEMFTYADIDIELSNNITSILSKLKRSGILGKVTKGHYYKIDPKFYAEPTIRERLSAYIDWENTYFSGLCIYAKLGLLDISQVPKEKLKPILATTSKNYKKIDLTLNVSFTHSLKVHYQIQHRKIDTIKLDSDIAIVLDAIKDLRIIYQYDPNIYDNLIKYILKMTEKEKNLLVEYSQYYEAGTRAVLGSIFDLLNNKITAQNLHKTLNNLTSFRVDFNYLDYEFYFDWRFFNKKLKKIKDS